MTTGTVRWQRLIPYIFLIPTIVVMVIFIYIPIIQNLVFSLYDWSAINPVWKFVGLGNYQELFQDPIFWKSFVNNLLFALISVAVQVFAALFLAAVLESGVFPFVFSNFFRTALFLPSVLAVTVIGFTWQLLYNPTIGLINQLLRAFGLNAWTHAWLGEETTAIFSVIAVSQWQWTGYIMILFIVAIQAISKELFEAAMLDGATAWQQFVHVTVPAVKETTLVMMAITVIGAFKVFDIVWVMTAGGPNNASEVLGSYMYRSAFRLDEMGYASTIATVILVITLCLTIVQLRLGGSGRSR